MVLCGVGSTSNSTRSSLGSCSTSINILSAHQSTIALSFALKNRITRLKFIQHLLALFVDHPTWPPNKLLRRLNRNERNLLLLSPKAFLQVAFAANSLIHFLIYWNHFPGHELCDRGS